MLLFDELGVIFELIKIPESRIIEPHPSQI